MSMMMMMMMMMMMTMTMMKEAKDSYMEFRYQESCRNIILNTHQTNILTGKLH